MGSRTGVSSMRFLMLRGGSRELGVREFGIEVVDCLAQCRLEYDLQLKLRWSVVAARAVKWPATLCAGSGGLWSLGEQAIEILMSFHPRCLGNMRYSHKGM